jgi:hypothetical protein
MTDGRRRVLTAQLSPDAYAGWQTYAAEHGLSATSLVEAFGLILPAGLPKRLESELLGIAGQVTAERRSRRTD